MTAAPSISPCVVSAPYRLSPMRVLLTRLHWSDGIVIAGLAVLGYVLDGPLLALTMTALVPVVMVATAFATRKRSGVERSFQAWPDGSYRCTVPGAMTDSNLGAATKIQRSRYGWAIKIAPRMFVVVPASALSEESVRQLDHLVANRRTIGSPAMAYTNDPLSTLPFNAQVAPVVRFCLARLVPRVTGLVVVLGIIRLALEPTGEISSATIATFAGLATIALGLPILVALRIARELRKPLYQSQRVCISPDAVEVYSTIGMSKLDRSMIKKIGSRSDAIIVYSKQPFIIPATAFRDADHRRTFEAALRDLANAPSE